MSKDTQAAMLKQLKNPFEPKFVKWRVGATNKEKTKGIALAYIDGREVQKRLDDVMGIAGWQDHYIPVDGGFICELSLLIDGVWVTKSNAAGNTNVDPIKGGASDALKRAAATWGIGRYLYYLPNKWVPIVPEGKSYKLSEIPELPAWAKPNTTIERWEDVAELELDMSATGDVESEEILEDDEIEVQIQEAKTSEDFSAILAKLDPRRKQAVAPLISNRRRELQNANASRGGTA